MTKVRRIVLSKFDFPIELDRSIVDGIIKGYKDYLAVRAEMQKRLKVSAAYAWTKGNHIDSFVNAECAQYDEIESTIEKAGYTWEYIQFTIKSSNEKYLLMIKNSGGIKRASTYQEQTASRQNYLTEYAAINNHLLGDQALSTSDSKGIIQLELSIPELDAIQNNVALKAPEGYDRFYVVTYEFDSDSKMISKIALTLPNQHEMKLIEVADLTPFISSSKVSINDNELAPVKNEQVPDSVYSGDTESFGYGVATNKPADSDQAVK